MRLIRTMMTATDPTTDMTPMKKLTSHFGLLAALSAAALFCAQAPRSSAQIYAADDATLYTTWTNGMNLGFGLGPWTLDQTGTDGLGDYTGFFIGHPGSIGSTNGNAWGMYANGVGGNNAAVAYRAFSNSLATATVFKIKWQSYGISTSNPNSVGGFSLRNGNATNSTADLRPEPGSDSTTRAPVRIRS